MGSYMSPLDPVFWCHHNMVEYCWVDWNINRNYANTNDAAWANHSFNGHFVDADGAPVNIAVAVTLLFPLLSYRYEPCGMGLMTRDVLSKIDAADFRKLREALTKGKEVRLDFRRQLEVASGFTLETGGKFSRPVSDFSAADLNRILASDSPERSLLTVEHEQLPETGDIFVRVFVNKPDAGPETTVDDPHYAGSVYYFVDPAAHRDHGGGRAVPTFLVDVTETIRRLSRSGERVDPGRFSVQLVLAPFEGRRPPPINLRIRSLRLGLSAIKIVPTV